MQTHVREGVRDYVVRNLLSGDARGFTDETDLQESRLLDSFATLELIQFLETTYGIQLGADQIRPGSFRNVSAIAQLVEEAQAGSSRTR